jgi:hypothetical protein
MESINTIELRKLKYLEIEKAKKFVEEYKYDYEKAELSYNMSKHNLVDIIKDEVEYPEILFYTFDKASEYLKNNISEYKDQYDTLNSFMKSSDMLDYEKIQITRFGKIGEPIHSICIAFKIDDKNEFCLQIPYIDKLNVSQFDEMYEGKMTLFHYDTTNCLSLIGSSYDKNDIKELIYKIFICSVHISDSGVDINSRK